MAEAGLNSLAVLLVEDNLYIRDILGDVLRHIGVGQVIEARNGQQAIERLRVTEERRAHGPVIGPDLVVADLVMSPINGLLLLRWLRMHKESPNRFMPFAMISGAADREYVAAARDLGVTEFLAKPFSAQSIADRVMGLINHPRQFVCTYNYFGPDRRRRRLGPPEPLPERRILSDRDATIVYSAERITRPSGAAEVWLFRLPNRLKEKAGGLGVAGDLAIPDSVLERAEKELARKALDFTEWAGGYLKQLSDLTAAADVAVSRRPQILEEINEVAHELRGQGGTFGYPLISVLARSLYDGTLPGSPADDATVRVIKAHTDAMRAVIRDRISGDGGSTGRAVLAGLKAAVDRIHGGGGGAPGAAGRARGVAKLMEEETGHSERDYDDPAGSGRIVSGS